MNDVGDPEPVTVKTYCNRVRVKEDPEASGWPRPFQLRAPLITDDPEPFNAGDTVVFNSRSEHMKFSPGDIPGHLETKSGSGSTFFVQYED